MRGQVVELMHDGLRIAIIGSRGYPSTYGGFETFVRHLAPYLASRGADVRVYDRERRRGRVRESMHNGVTVVRTRGIRTRQLSTLSFGATAAWHASRQDIDVALILNTANGFWLPLLRRAGIPIVANVDGIEWERDKWSRLGKAVFRLGAKVTARLADEIVVDSQAIGQYWEQVFGRASNFIAYGANIPAQLSTDKLADLDLEPGSYVLVVARLVPENNVEMLLNAMEGVPERPMCVVVGSSGEQTDLEQRLRQLSDGRAYRWLGHVSDQELLNQLWQNCALYVHGHSVGGTNPALLQALGAGAPSLVFKSPYNLEVVGGDWPSFQDATTLTEQIRRLLAAESDREELARMGQAIVRKRYSWSEVCKSYYDLLEELALRKSTRASSSQSR